MRACVHVTAQRWDPVSPVCAAGLCVCAYECQSCLEGAVFLVSPILLGSSLLFLQVPEQP